MANLYAIRNPPMSVRLAERAHLEEKLEKWFLDLPEYLRFDVYSHQRQSTTPATSLTLPPPHVITLHMQYWCTVLLLHRPLLVPFDGSLG